MGKGGVQAGPISPCVSPSDLCGRGSWWVVAGREGGAEDAARRASK